MYIYNTLAKYEMKNWKTFVDFASRAFISRLSKDILGYTIAQERTKSVHPVLLKILDVVHSPTSFPP